MAKVAEKRPGRGKLKLPRGVTRRALRDIARRHGAGNVRVFGSRVAGAARSESDLDLLVDFEPGRDLFDVVGLKEDLEAYTGLRVDVLTERALSPFIREDVLRQAVAL